MTTSDIVLTKPTPAMIEAMTTSPPHEDRDHVHDVERLCPLSGAQIPRRDRLRQRGAAGGERRDEADVDDEAERGARRAHRVGDGVAACDARVGAGSERASEDGDQARQDEGRARDETETAHARVAVHAELGADRGVEKVTEDDEGVRVDELHGAACCRQVEHQAQGVTADKERNEDRDARRHAPPGALLP